MNVILFLGTWLSDLPAGLRSSGRSDGGLDEYVDRETVRIDALASMLFQICLAFMIGGITLAVAFESAPDLSRIIVGVASFLVGLLGINAGLVLLRVEKYLEKPDEEEVITALRKRRDDVNAALFWTVWLILAIAITQIIGFGFFGV